jgi:hypothetical protein
MARPTRLERVTFGCGGQRLEAANRGLTFSADRKNPASRAWDLNLDGRHLRRRWIEQERRFFPRAVAQQVPLLVDKYAMWVRDVADHRYVFPTMSLAAGPKRETRHLTTGLRGLISNPNSAVSLGASNSASPCGELRCSQPTRIRRCRRNRNADRSSPDRSERTCPNSS